MLEEPTAAGLIDYLTCLLSFARPVLTPPALLLFLTVILAVGTWALPMAPVYHVALVAYAKSLPPDESAKFLLPLVSRYGFCVGMTWDRYWSRLC